MRVFGGASSHGPRDASGSHSPARRATTSALARALAQGQAAVFLLGSQVTLRTQELARTIESVESLGVPVVLSGMARGLLGRKHPLWLRHHRGEALKHADFVLLAGVPADFRLNYGRSIGRKAQLVTVNLSAEDGARTGGPSSRSRATQRRSSPRLRMRRAASSTSAGSSTARCCEPRRLARAEDSRRRASRRARGQPGVRLSRGRGGAREDSVWSPTAATSSARHRTSWLRARRSWLDPGVFGTLGVGQASR